MAKKQLSSRVRRKIAQWYSDREAGAAAAEIESALEVRTKTRLRLWECEESACGKKLRVADDNLRAYHEHVDADTGEVALVPFVLRTPILVTSSSVPF
jgi:hypothetical protein